MKTDLFQSCGHCWVFQICWHIDWNTFTASSFRIWNSSTGFPSPPLALFVVMLPKAHLTSHSGMSGSRWVITPLWLSWSWRSFLYSSFVYCCHFFFYNICCFYNNIHTISVLYWAHLYIKCSLGISSFLEGNIQCSSYNLSQYLGLRLQYSNVLFKNPPSFCRTQIGE